MHVTNCMYNIIGQTCIYIYIYIYRERERDLRVILCLFVACSVVYITCCEYVL